MSKIQLYDILEKKVVDIPEKEIENVKNMGRIFTEIGRIWESHFPCGMPSLPALTFLDVFHL